MSVVTLLTPVRDGSWAVMARHLAWMGISVAAMLPGARWPFRLMGPETGYLEKGKQTPYRASVTSGWPG
jgi:hypothetical protein